MASIKHVVDKMTRQPNGISIHEADRVLRHYGYYLVRQRGSHLWYENAAGDSLSIVERRSSIKAVYVKKIVAKLGL